MGESKERGAVISMELIKSISFDQNEILKQIVSLHTGDIELDITYGAGNFYKAIKQPKHKIDIVPRFPDVVCGDSTKLPFADNTISSIMFDPPFMISGGPSFKSNKVGSNILHHRFSWFKKPELLREMYGASIIESFRILKTGGWLIVKCQDQVSSGKQFFLHCEVYDMAKQAGFYPKDLFILIAKQRLVPNWQKKQQHARKFHSYFWIFQKK
jgi:hypothetical protein